MKKKFLLFSILLAFTTLQAQDNAAVEKSQFKINVLVPGIVYEHGFSDKNTLYSEVSLGFGYRSHSFIGSTWDFYPVINEQFRHYYNLEKRAAKGKVTAHNSGGFVAFTAAYFFESSTTNDSFAKTIPSLTVGPVWGFERTYKGNFNLGLNLGIGYNMDKFEDEFTLIANFSLGWVIGK
ncbi:hypothetical protein [Flavobacterium hiemivividum]|uniref:DUF3575 domain-containing protein n=1 Tax=Flavobacterium hiemivividum TaxID=2541734 RepID=A0A4R5D5G8_9FLAO|nr:hypothetical protein [Flavobacterium hiemivividum]TDE05645.1 hypothetical protein E0F98_05855 [Flavobacterium hiemivividum]